MIDEGYAEQGNPIGTLRNTSLSEHTSLLVLSPLAPAFMLLTFTMCTSCTQSNAMRLLTASQMSDPKSATVHAFLVF